ISNDKIKFINALLLHDHLHWNHRYSLHCHQMKNDLLPPMRNDHHLQNDYLTDWRKKSGMRKTGFLNHNWSNKPYKGLDR
ncbi:hypothetical protein ND861_19545, partial [Leptospira sp. 2 VSF19]